MTAIEFCYFLQGFLETGNPKEINQEQTQIIKDHLKLVFTKVTPDYGNTITVPANPPSHIGWPPISPYIPNGTDPFQTICGGINNVRATCSTSNGYPEGSTISNTDNSVTYCATT